MGSDKRQRPKGLLRRTSTRATVNMSLQRVTLQDARANIGREVWYETYRQLGKWYESGVITSVNDHYVFVRYEGRWQPAATRPEDLVWAPRPQPV